MQLLQLKLWYNRYQDFWQQWKGYKHSGLNFSDIEKIEMFRDQNFRIDTNLLEKFHTRNEIYEQLEIPLVIKLQANYPEFKEWVSMWFQLSIIKYASAFGIDKFIQLPLTVLPIELEARKHLELFGCKNINEILLKFKNEDYVSDAGFKTVLRQREFILKAPTKEMYVLEEVLSEKC